MINLDEIEARKKAIGARIKKERNELKLTQDQFKDKIYISARQTIASWEQGKSLPSLNDMILMCKLFNCELGYLLYEQDCKTRTATDIKAVTGLSQKAISRISSEVKGKGICLTSSATITERKALNNILEFSDGVALRLIARYLYPDELSYIEEIETNDLKEAVLCMDGGDLPFDTQYVRT